MYRRVHHTETLCSAHTVYLGFVLLSQQTAIISLHNINRLVLVTEAVCVYCAVRTHGL